LQVIKKWKQRQQLAKWLKDHGKNLEEINSLLEQWGKGEQVDIITVQQLIFEFIENIYLHIWRLWSTACNLLSRINIQKGQYS
jgi:hypothetical protein